MREGYISRVFAIEVERRRGRQHWPDSVQQAEELGRPLPRFVVREVEA